MPYYTEKQIEHARSIDLLTYLQTYEPTELVHVRGNTYCTREHDSLKISNGKWYWFSRSIGGHNALDYLIKVKGLPFMEAVETIMGNVAVKSPMKTEQVKKPISKVLLLPQVNSNADRAVGYLMSRGIDREIIDYCIHSGRLYESYPHHNVVFVDWTDTGNQDMPTCAVPVPILREKLMAATSDFLSASRQTAAIRCICLKVQLTFSPMPPSVRMRAWTGEPII